MPVFSRVKSWVSNEVLTASDLNAEFNNLLNNTIPASIEDYSADVSTMQSTADPGGVGTESLATTLAGELQRIRFAIKRIVGGAQWYSAPVIDLGSTIGTADIADSAVTRAKIESVGQQVSSSSGAFSYNTNTTATDVTNLSVSITTTGRPVRVEVIHDGSANQMNLSFDGNTFSFSGRYKILRGATVIYDRSMTSRVDNSATYMQHSQSPPFTLDIVAAGTYTYKVQVKLDSVASSNVAYFQYAKLVAYEL